MIDKGETDSSSQQSEEMRTKLHRNTFTLICPKNHLYEEEAADCGKENPQKAHC